MFELKRASSLVALLGTILAAALASAAQTPGGKIYCWKNAKGQTECGDQPPADASTRQMTGQGVTVGKKEAPAPASPEALKAKEEEEARKKAEKEQAERQQRTDRALLDSFSNENEIELKRKRDIAPLESQITTLTTSYKNADDRLAEAKRRAGPKPAPAQQEEIARIEQERSRTLAQISKQKEEIAALNKQYDGYVARFRQLKGGAAAPAPAAAPAAAPSAKPAAK